MENFLKKTFPKGVHFDDRKMLSAKKSFEEMPSPNEVFVSLGQHLGAPSSAVVAVGDVVKKGQLIAKANGGLGTNVFSSIGGEVVAIAKKQNVVGNKIEHIHIKNNGSEEILLLPQMQTRDQASVLSRIFEAGIIGMGGAGFPTNVKLKPAKPVDTLIINAAECEPYITCDHQLMLEKTKEVIEGANLMAIACGVKNVIFGVEANKMDAAQLLVDCGANVTVLEKKYPQGAEKHLIFAVLSRAVPCGGLPMDVGVVVQNVATAFATYEAVEKNLPLFRRAMTVTGKAVANPKNIFVANGTTAKDVFEFCGGLKEDVAKTICGGPMMGFAFFDHLISTTKTTNAFLALTAKESEISNPTPCINCTKCAQVCPMNLSPMYLDFYGLVMDLDNCLKFGVMNCCECGTCAYVCPAKRAIVQSVRLAKAKLKERK